MRSKEEQERIIKRALSMAAGAVAGEPKTDAIEALQARTPHPVISGKKKLEPESTPSEEMGELVGFFPSPQPEPAEWLRKPRTVRFMTPEQRAALDKEIAGSVEALKKELTRLRELAMVKRRNDAT